MDRRTEQKKIESRIDGKSNKITQKIKENNVFAQISMRWGRSETLYNYFWWDIKINSICLKHEFRDYTDILLMPYRITADIINNELRDKEIKEIQDEKNIVIVKADAWGIKENTTHLDPSTGNIHPASWNFEEWDGFIKQLILAKSKDNGHLGPRIAFSKNNQEFEFQKKKMECIEYRRDSGRGINRIAIPSKCYYPEIFSDQSSEDINEMLDEMLKNICK